METIEIRVAFNEGDEVYFRQAQDHLYVVTGYIIQGPLVRYLVNNPEIGEVDALEHELITERTIF